MFSMVIDRFNGYWCFQFANGKAIKGVQKLQNFGLYFIIIYLMIQNSKTYSSGRAFKGSFIKVETYHFQLKSNQICLRPVDYARNWFIISCS